MGIEMISPWMIYWITRLDVVCIGLAILCGLSISIAVLLLFLLLLDNDRESCFVLISDIAYGLLSKYACRLLVVGAIASIGLVVTPTTKQMAAIYIIPVVANNEKVQGEASELYGLAKDYLESQMGVGNEKSGEKLK